MRTDLQNDSLVSLQRTLSDLADPDRQLAYKSDVPFVHVPIELLEQWSRHVRLLEQATWFRSLFTPDQVALLVAFDSVVAKGSLFFGQPLPDVPDILEVPAWRDVIRAAAELLPWIPAPSDTR